MSGVWGRSHPRVTHNFEFFKLKILHIIMSEDLISINVLKITTDFDIL